MTYIQSKNKFTNLDEYPYNWKFSSYLLTQDVNIKIKNIFTNFNNYPIIHILLFLYDKNNFRQHFIFENENYDVIIKDKLEEIRQRINFIENKEFIQNIITDLAYYTNPQLLDLWYSYFPEIYNRDYNYYYSWNSSFYNLMKSAIENNKYENILYLKEKHNFDFWENTCQYNILSKDILNNIEIFGDFNYNDEETVIKISQLIYNTNSKKLINLFMNSDLINKTDNIISILENYINYDLFEIIKYIVNHKSFPINFLTIIDWNSILEQIYDFNTNYNNNKKLHIKSKIYHFLIKKILSIQNISINEIIKYQSLNNNSGVICNMVRLPNINRTLDLFIDYITFSEIELIDLYTSVIKYGDFETFQYLNFKYNILDFKFKETYELFISMSLLNKNKKITKYLFEMYKYKDLKLNYDFINKKGSCDNKIKKLKLISKYVNLKENNERIIDSLFHTHQKTNKIIKWYIKKVFNNCINSDINLKQLLIAVTQNRNNELLEYFLSTIDKNYNFWNLVPCMLSMSTWLCQSTNILLKYCDLYCDTLFNQSEILKNDICIKMLLPSLLGTNFTFKTNDYLKIFKILKKNKINFIKILEESYEYEFIRNKELIKALLYEEFDIHKLLMYVYQCNYWNYDNNGLTKWIHLKNLVKRKRIAKDIANKKIHNYFYKESIVNLETKPEKEGDSLISRGSNIFYHNMDELDSMYENISVQYKYPVHIEPHQLIDISKTTLWVNQKTDGLTSIDINQDNLFPAVNFEYIKMDGEYIKELDLYLVFGLRSYTKKYNTPIDDYNDLVFEHQLCKDFIKTNNYLDSGNQIYIYEKLKSEAIEIMEFCSKYKDKANKWYPKKVWNIIDPSLNLGILNIIENYQNMIYTSCIKDITMNGFIEQSEIKTDGIILMKSKKELYKYKQERNMTADLSIDNKIYRCYWNNEKWDPRELRLDKKYPNPLHLVDKLTHYHKHPWKIEDIILYQYEMNSKIVYYQKNLKDYHFNQYSNINKKVFNEIIRKHYYNKESNYLDLGCGFCNSLLWKDKHIKIDGIDIDISVLVKKTENKNKNIFIINFANKWQKKNNIINRYYNNEEKIKNNYNIVIMNFSIQYVFKKTNGFKEFITELNNRTESQCRLFISMICLSKSLYLTNESFIKIIDPQIEYKDDLISQAIPSWYQTYYSSRHTKPIKEPRININGFEKLMNFYGWKLNRLFEKENYNIHPNWNQLYSSIKNLEFIKM